MFVAVFRRLHFSVSETMQQATAFLGKLSRCLHCASVLESAWRFAMRNGGWEGVICSVINISFIFNALPPASIYCISGLHSKYSASMLR